MGEWKYMAPLFLTSAPDGVESSTALCQPITIPSYQRNFSLRDSLHKPLEFSAHLKGLCFFGLVCSQSLGAELDQVNSWIVSVNPSRFWDGGGDSMVEKFSFLSQHYLKKSSSHMPLKYDTQNNSCHNSWPPNFPCCIFVMMLYIQSVQGLLVVGV
jgi:hypothetical protein